MLGSRQLHHALGDLRPCISGVGGQTTVQPTDHDKRVIRLRLKVATQLGGQEDPPLVVNGDFVLTEKLRGQDLLSSGEGGWATVL